MHSRLTEDQMRARFERGSHAYRGYKIVAKRDYSDLLAFDRGFYLRDGFVVVKDGANAMPGAIWFKDIDSATRAIDILETVGEEKFWPAYEQVKRETEAARQSALAKLATA